MKFAFSNSLDKRLASTYYIAARASVHHCALVEQKALITSKVASASAGYLFLERCYDDTPVPLAFGQLAEKIAPFARFIVPIHMRESVGKALVNYQECTHYGVPVAQHGILDIFQQRVCLDFGPGEHVEALVPARILLGKSAGHVFNAVQSALGHAWSIEKLAELAKDIILVVDCADSDSTNRNLFCLQLRSQVRRYCALQPGAWCTSFSGAS